MKKIIGIGNALVDVLVKLKNDDILIEYNLPKGSMQLVDKSFVSGFAKRINEFEISIASGGSASNTIHGLANLGVETGYIGKIGTDNFGEIFKNDMINNNVHPHLLTGSEESGRAITFISPDKERTFATFLGAAIEMKPDEISSDLFTDFDILHIEGYLVQDNKLIENAIKIAKKNNLKVSLDLASYNVVEANLNFLKKIVKDYVDIVFANEEEAKAFTGEEPCEAVNTISELCEIAIVKVGNRGSHIKTGSESIQVGIRKVDVIDTTGAGDLYAAGFLYGLINDMALLKCGEIAALLASKVIEVIGPKIPEEVWYDINDEVHRIKEIGLTNWES